ncbi:MAG: hypothetical protein ACR2QW_01090 [bacterium]
MKYPKIPIFILAAALSTSTLVVADDDDEEPFDEARLFFELNDTDGDLGIHGKIDGDEWKYLEIEDPRDRKMLNIWVRGRLRKQGLTELFFESAEPTFDELDPEKFFRRFPEGEYDIEGYTLDWEEKESEVYLSHVIPAAPDGVSVNGEPMASLESCEGEDGAPDIPTVEPQTPEEIITISWDPVMMSHAEKHGPGGPDPREYALGEIGVIDVRYYEIVVEVDETDFKQTAIIPGGKDEDGELYETEWDFTDDFFEVAEVDEMECTDDSGRMCAQYKYEILVRTNVYDDDGNPVILEVDGEEDNLQGNKSAVESCFLVPEDED